MQYPKQQINYNYNQDYKSTSLHLINFPIESYFGLSNPTFPIARPVSSKPNKNWGSLDRTGTNLVQFHQNRTRLGVVWTGLVPIWSRITKRVLTLYKTLLTLPFFNLTSHLFSTCDDCGKTNISSLFRILWELLLQYLHLPQPHIF